MGKILRDSDGNIVSVGGAPVLERTLERKPKNCQGCGFNSWSKGDKVFIFQSNNNGMEWICPDCAIQRGLPEEHYHRNELATAHPPSSYLLATSGGVADFFASICQS